LGDVLNRLPRRPLLDKFLTRVGSRYKIGWTELECGVKATPAQCSSQPDA
jgi:hypothetical protein